MLSASLSLLVINNLLAAFIPIVNLFILALFLVIFLYALQSAGGSFFIFDSPRYRHFHSCFHTRVDSDPYMHGRGPIHIHGRDDRSHIHGRDDRSHPHIHGRDVRVGFGF
ncbi:MAG TPA: hypothetical protein DCZ80_02110 [Legionellales bacterium]|nr:hypothetical protein [Legionellales bacterium]